MSSVTTSNKKTFLSTTFNRLREAQACTQGYRKLAKYLGGVDVYGADKPIPLAVILESNGVDDCLWCLRATIEDAEPAARRLAIQFAEQALPIFEKYVPGDSRPRDAIIAAKRFAEGEIELATLLKAGDAARDAARAAARPAARDAARAAARVAAGDAAGDAAWAAARVAAGDAAWAAAGDAAWDAAWAAARVAAGDAAWAAAGDAAGAAARAAARDAAWAAARAAARAAAGDAAGAEQAQMILAELAFDVVMA